MQAYTYLLLMTATLGFPLALSFDRKVAFYKKWKSLLPGLLFTAMVFIIWDVWFTREGVWSFNPDYLIGVYILNLPIEEWMFFFVVPFACVFIYECLIAYFPSNPFASLAQPLSYGLAVLLIVVASVHPANLYTLITFYSLAVVLVLLAGWHSPFLGRFYQTYLVHLIPFLVINGVLTALPVVIYNDAENLGIRLGTIPIEDSAYSMLLLLMNISFYEWFKSRAGHSVFQMEKRYE
jgi:lycopene cyclase domain-containing protein